MADVDFSDRDSIQNWMETQSHEVRGALSGRAILRILPCVCLTAETEFDDIALKCLRAALIAALRGIGRLDLSTIDARTKEAETALGLDSLPWPNSTNSAGLYAFYLSVGPRQSVGHSAGALFYAAESIKKIPLVENSMYETLATSLVSSVATSLATPLYLSTERPEDSMTAFLSAASEDLQHIEQQNEPPIASWLHSTPLWAGAGPSGKFIEYHEPFLEMLASDAKWEFWHDWYLAMWDGTFTDWDLALEVIKIEDAVWKAGAEAVALEIERINARHAVKTAINDIRKVGRTDEASRHSIGGNSPPEALTDPIAMQSVTLIWASLDSLEAEVEKAEPDRETVEQAYRGLKSGLSAFIKWAGRKTDLAIDSAIKWGVPMVGAGYAAVNPDKIAGLIKLVEQVLKLFH